MPLILSGAWPSRPPPSADAPGSCRSAGAPGGTYEVDGPEKVLATLEASFTLMPELRALLNDLAPTVRENAMLAVGRLGRLSDNLNAQIAEEDTLGAAITTPVNDWSIVVDEPRAVPLHEVRDVLRHTAGVRKLGQEAARECY